MADTPIPPSDISGLPPVVPPSGRMIAQLFVVPGLIVAGAVVILLGFSWLAGGARTPDGFLDGLKNANPEVRWRTASDLAQVLQRDDSLASDVNFGIELVKRLQDALADVAKPVPLKPKDVPEDKRRSAGQDWHNYQIRRSEAQYLAACVGNLSIPVGAPVLGNMAKQQLSADEKTDAILRRQAVWALASLGNNRQRFDRLNDDLKQAVLAEITQQSGRTGESADWCKSAAEILRKENTGGVIAALAKCSTADDPFLRKQTALALSFWPGNKEENLQAEETLMRLTRDDGRGQAIVITDKD